MHPHAWTFATGLSRGSYVPFFSHRCQGDDKKMLALAQLLTGLWWWEFTSNVISPMTRAAFTESGISLHYLPFCAWFILTPLYLELGMLCCKGHVTGEHFCTSQSCPKSRCGWLRGQLHVSWFVFIPVDPLEPSGIASGYALCCGLVALHK